ELHPVVGEVSLARYAGLRVAQVVGDDLEGVQQLTSLAHEETSDFERLIEPLVRVERDGVGELEAARRSAAALAEHREGAVRAVDVEPDAALLADRGDLRERIDGAGARRSSDGCDEERLPAGPDVPVHPVPERARSDSGACLGRP